jgi:integrase
MPTQKLTKRAVDDLPFASGKPIYYRDADLPGFGVRVGVKRKSWFVETAVNRRNVRHTIGSCSHIPLERARQLAKSRLGEMAEGRDPNAARKTARVETLSLKAAFDAFFEARTNLSPTSVPNYRRSINFHLREWATKPIAAITRDMIIHRHRKIATTSGGVTANNVMRHLGSVWNFTSATAGPLPPNPVRVLSDARAWTVERRRRTLISRHDFPRWFSAVMQETENARDFLLIAIFTGMRSSEIESLSWMHLDLDGRTLTVPKTKNGEPLVLPLSNVLHELFAMRRELNPKGEWVFPGPGKTGHLVEPKRFAERVAAKSGVRFTMHDLRRTFASIANSVGVSTLALKGLLNHRTDNDVTGGYVVATAEDYRGPAERIAQRIVELANGDAVEIADRESEAWQV